MTNLPPASEPPTSVTDPVELFLAYLDWYREAAIRKVTGMAEADLRSSRLPSGWTPIELLNHLAFMERRWLQWGWGGREVSDPWGDNRRPDDTDDPDPDAPWYVGDATPLEKVVARLRASGDATHALVTGRDLHEQAPPGPRFEPGEPVPNLGWILIHVLQEYARHVGHLDVVRELADGLIGE